ncbi:MAG TPA: tetratricopeptide repeat protein [Sphingomicrobium sp.]|nr:tetratricopeptide repeat protein [Sphingomicrobium sp.]
MEDPIIPICKRTSFATLLIGLPLAPLAAANPVDPGQLLSTYVEARTADAIGDQGRAARLFATLASADPANPTLARRAIASAIDSGDTGLALRVARTLPADALTLDARLLLVADALRRRQSNEAIMFVASGSDDDGGFVAPLLRAWSDQAARRDGSAALAALPKTTLLAPFVDEQRVAMLLASRRVDEAMLLVPGALTASGGRETRLRLAFAAMLARAGAKDKAQALLAGEDPALRRLDLRSSQLGIAIDTPAAGFAELLLGLAVGLAQGNDRSFPLTLVQIARHAAPDSSEASILLALLLDRQGREAEALAALAAVPANDPFVDDVRDAQVRLLLELKRGPEALAAAQRAAALPEALANDHGRLGNVLAELDRPTEAAEAYARGAALASSDGSTNGWTYRLLRAAQLDDLERWPEARAELTAALAASPNQPLLLNYLGYGSLERGENLDQAEGMIRRALALRPGDPAITDSLGWALYKRGRLPEAIETLTKAAIAQPADAEIQEHLGDALYQAGRRYEARFAWRAALISAEAIEARRIEAKIAAGWSKATAAP